jgi:uncharacterized membrane protein
MTEPAVMYTPLDLQERFRQQAIKVWLITSAVVFLWITVIVAAPLFLSKGVTAASSPIYTFFSYICHQIPERSLHLAGHQMAVCSRCFGVYVGLLAGILIYPLWRSIDEIDAIPRIWLFLSLVPISIDWSLTIFGIWENTHVSRFVTGGILGIACATYIVPALVEVVRNLSYRRVITQ